MHRILEDESYVVETAWHTCNQCGARYETLADEWPGCLLAEEVEANKCAD